MVANMANHESRVQALASCEPSTARIHTSGEEDSCGKLSRIGLGSVLSTLCGSITVKIKNNLAGNP